MEIIGHGMIAHALDPFRDVHPEAVVFASGVANSRTTAAADYDRELNLLYAALQRCVVEDRRLVYFSSGGAVYGNNQSARSEDTPTYPMSVYGRHKLLCEAVIRSSGARHLILRLANLVGPGQNPNQLIPALVSQIRSGEVTIYSEASRDLMDVADFTRILVSLLTHHTANDTLVVATGFSASIIEIVTVLEQIMGMRSQRTLIAGGEKQQFDVNRVRALLPSYTEFPNNYYEQVLRRLVRQIHR